VVALLVDDRHLGVYGVATRLHVHLLHVPAKRRLELEAGVLSPDPFQFDAPLDLVAALAVPDGKGRTLRLRLAWEQSPKLLGDIASIDAGAGHELRRLLVPTLPSATEVHSRRRPLPR